MKVVQINVVYAQGSTGRIVETLHREYLKRGIDSYVIYGRGPLSEDPRAIRSSYLWEAKLWRFISLFTGNVNGGVPFSTRHIEKTIAKIKPDVVHLHCINGNMVNIYALLRWLRKQGIKTILTHHAEFMYTGGCGFAMCDKWKTGCEHCPHKREVFGKLSLDRSKRNWNRFKEVFTGFAGLTNVYVSPWLSERASQSPFLKDLPKQTILNPVDIAIFNHPSVLSSPQEIEGKPYVFLPISKFGVDNKGADSIEEIADRLGERNLILAIAGAPHDHHFLSPNIVNVGFVSSPNQMASLYYQAVCTLIVSKVESFSMPVAESLCCGTPVVGFKAGGPESIAIPNYSQFVELGHVEDLIAAVEKFVENPIDRAAAAQMAAETYASSGAAESYIRLY